MQDEELKEILQRYRDGKATAAEQALLESWYLQYQVPERPAYTPEMLEEDAGLVLQQLQQPLKKPARVLPLRRIAAAAVVTLILSAGLIYYLLPAEQTKQPGNSVYSNDIAPGSNQAFLTLADGSQHPLSTMPPEKSADISHIDVRDGRLVYAKKATAKDAEITYNILETPKGGQWQIVLPDGTQVWLNAASSLKYPVAFSGRERSVELTGEAYFEVAKDATRPFIVRSKGQEVKVLGTHFNVNAYDDEPRITTTLLEGAVSISAGGRQQILKPGEQSSITGDAIKVNEVDTESAMAWKNGYFLFESEDIMSIMRKVSRWYNVEVVYTEGKVPVHHFWGTVSRFQQVSQVLKKLELTGHVHFKIEGRKIFVMQ